MACYQTKLLLLALLINTYVRSIKADGLSLYDMLAAEGKSNPHDIEPVAQQTQTNPVYTEYQTSPDPKFNAQISSLLATNVLQMAHDVGEILLQTNNEKTEVFSPLSIYGALTLLLLGSNGNTHQELLNVMGLSRDQYLTSNPWKIHEEFGVLIDDLSQNIRNEQHPRPQPNWKVYGNPRLNVQKQTNDGDEYKIAVANGVFVQQGFSIRPDYQTAVLNVYKSNIQNLDFARNGFQASKYINDWVNEKTRGKIPEIVSYLLPETKVVLASALYFKAMWETTFIEGATGPKDFYPDGHGTTPITVQMMAHGGSFPFYDATEYDCRILALPYRRNLSTMYIILPNNSSRNRLRQLQAYLTADKIEDMIQKMQWKTAIILFPKMHITNKVDLRKTFEKMGLHSLFDERRSDLSLLSNGYEAVSGNSPVQAAQYYPSGGSSANGFSGQDYSSSLFNNNKFGGSGGGYKQVHDDDDEPFIFSRHGEDNENESNDTITTTSTEPPTTEKTDSKPAERRKRYVTYKVPSSARSSDESLRFKDYIVSKRIVKGNSDKKVKRYRRQYDPSLSLKNLDRIRGELSQGHGQNPGLFATEILHKVDLTVNEKGTEGGAATVVTLYRTGTDVVFRVDTPFMFIIRHDDTKLPLFYGTVMEPTN